MCVLPSAVSRVRSVCAQPYRSSPINPPGSSKKFRTNLDGETWLLVHGNVMATPIRSKGIAHTSHTVFKDAVGALPADWSARGGVWRCKPRCHHHFSRCFGCCCERVKANTDPSHTHTHVCVPPSPPYHHTTTIPTTYTTTITTTHPHHSHHLPPPPLMQGCNLCTTTSPSVWCGSFGLSPPPHHHDTGQQ